MKRGERVAAVGKAQARIVGRSDCRAPQQEQIRKADRTRHDLYNQRGDGVRRAKRRRKV